AVAIDGRVAAAVDDATARTGDLQPVAMPPHARVRVEVRREIALVALVTPEVQRHRRNGPGAHKLPNLVDHGLALLVPGLDRAAQEAALHFAGYLGQLPVAADEGPREIGAAGDVAPPDIRRADLLELPAAPALRIFRQGRTGHAQCPHAAQVAAGRKINARLHADGEECGAGTEKGDAEVGGETPEHAPVG